MPIKKIDELTFSNYANTHPLRTYHQTSSYAKYMENKGYKHEYIALFDENENILAASLILFKKLGFVNKYGYAPKGFLIDYHNQELLTTFVTELKKFYFKRNFAFIKINPEIAIGEINLLNNSTSYNKNLKIVNILENNNFVRIGPNYHFETLQPRFNAILPLKLFNFDDLPKQFKTKIRSSSKNGLTFEKVGKDKLNIIYEFVKKKKNRTLEDYNNYYNCFSPSIDLFLIKIDFEKYLINIRNLYEKELERNNILVNKMLTDKTILKKKMESDKLLNEYENDIVFATQNLARQKEKYIAGAITLKYQNRISIIASGYNTKYKKINPNHFLHYELINYYQKNYEFIDLNGITGDFDKKNPYYGLNKFKMNLKPKCFEYIGEFDLVINQGLYKGMNKSGLIKDEFEKKQKQN